MYTFLSTSGNKDGEHSSKGETMHKFPGSVIIKRVSGVGKLLETLGSWVPGDSTGLDEPRVHVGR